MAQKDYRSAIKGTYVTEAFAKKHPKITVSETRKKPQGPSGAGKRKKR